MRNLAEFSGGSAIRYFTVTRRKNAGGAPSGMTVALALPSAVREMLTVRPSEENADSFSSVAPSTPNASASRAPSPISASAMLTEINPSGG